ncbi:MAG: hypothetical protein ABI891_13455 [Acidobacteriota bacterium]
MLTTRFLTIYSGVLTFVFAITVLTGFSNSSKTEIFDTINAHRINITEPDGTLRMVISNHDKLPGVIVKGKEEKLDRP